MDRDHCSVCGNGLMYHAMGADHEFLNPEDLRDAENEVSRLRQRVKELEKALACEKEWVQALTEDNGHLIIACDKGDIKLPTGPEQEKLRTCTIAHDHFRPGSCWGCMNEEAHNLDIAATEAKADLAEEQARNERLLRIVQKLLPLRRLRPVVTAAAKMLETHHQLLEHMRHFGDRDEGDRLSEEQQAWLLELEAAVQYARD